MSLLTEDCQLMALSLAAQAVALLGNSMRDDGGCVLVIAFA
jgi:hypothetical protein